MRPILKTSLCFSIVALLAGCSVLFPFTPHATYDFSALGKDVFSNLVRDVYSKRQSQVHIKFHRDTGPFARTIVVREYMSDETHNLNVTIRLRNFWMGKSRAEVEGIFTQAGGRCLPPKTGPTEKYLYCEVVRQWRQTGAHIPDGSAWSYPTEKLAHTFALSETDRVIGLNLKFIDLIKYPPLNIKSPKIGLKDK